MNKVILNYLIIPLLVVLAVFTSCKKNDDTYNNVNKGDIFVVGIGWVEDDITVAKLWKNGVVQNLLDGTNRYSTNAVYVSEGNVYVAGSESNGEREVPIFWKNGVTQSLPNGIHSARATSIFVVE